MPQELPPFAGVHSAPAAEPRADAARRAMRELEAWAWSRGWQGSDPYDALNGSRAKLIGRTPFSRRVVIQLARRSPVSFDRLLGVPRGENANTIAHALQAYARMDDGLGIDLRSRAEWAVERLDALRCADYEEPCWSYHFDVETRFFFYSAQTPNTIATSFAAHALLEAADRFGLERARELATGAGSFFLRRIERTPDPDGGSGAYLGYFPGDRTAIHNSSLLGASVLARLARGDGLAAADAAEAAEVAASAVRYGLDHMRPDGSWPYADDPEGRGGWVDNLHTGYVLDALLRCGGELEGAEAEAALEGWERGLAYYRARLFDPDGAARNTDRKRYPLDGQYLAQALETLAAASDRHPELLSDARRVLDFGLANLRRPDGAFVYQRHARYTIRAPHMRWVEAPMLAALASFAAAERRAEQAGGGVAA